MQMPDSDIVAFIVAGDPDGVAAAYDRYADALYKYCRSILGDPDAPADAANAVQDTFLVAASRLAGLSDPRRLRAWLYAVARNECVRILRSRDTTPAPPGPPGEADAVIDITEGSAERAELRALFAAAARGLDPDEREVLELWLRQGIEPGEVAAVLGVSGSHVHVLASRAHEQLEACLAVLLFVRARRECGELDAILAGWDGRLTVALRKRVHRHIQRCPTCSTQLALELGPAALLGRSAGAAMAGAAAESLRLAPGTPDGLREHTVSLATGQDHGAVASRAAAAGRAGTFGRDGFPQPQRHSGAMAGLRSAPRARAVVAAAVVAGVAIAATAFALSGGTGSAALSMRKPPAGHVGASAGPETTASATATVPATRRPAAARPPATGQAGTTAAPSPTPSASATPTLAPTPATQGSVTVSLAGSGPVQPGTPLTLSAGGGGTPITLTAIGGPVTWSVTVSGGPPGHRVSVSGPSSGTLQPGQSVQVLLMAIKKVNGVTLTINPGGAAYPLVASSQVQ